MSVILFIFCLFAFASGASNYSDHNYLGAAACSVISALFFASSVIVNAINQVRDALEQGDSLRLKKPKPSPPPVIIESSKQSVPPEQKYYFSLDGVDWGPYNAGEIRNYLKIGKINYETLVFKFGDSGWHPLAHYTEIFN